MDQDGFILGIMALATLILLSGLHRGAFEIQFIRAERMTQPLRYWLSALVLALVALEAFRRAWFIGCAEC